QEALAALAAVGPAEVCIAVRTGALVSFLEAIKEGRGAKLQRAVEALEALGGLKAPKGGGSPRSETDSVKLSQRRMLTYLGGLPKNGSATRQQLCCVALGKPLSTPASEVTMDGSQLGNINGENPHQYSLIGRGWVEVVKVENEGKEETRLKLTDAGRKAA